MNRQLLALVDDLETAHDRLRHIDAAASEDAWTRRPKVDGWSVAECVSHLNLTSRAYLPLLRQGLENARAAGGAPPSQLRQDLIGWLLWKGSGPNGRIRMKTSPAFVPESAGARPELMDEFGRLQAEQIACVLAAEGLPIQKIKVASPFYRRVRYSLYSALAILPAHQHRHLGQAERALATI